MILYREDAFEYLNLDQDPENGASFEPDGRMIDGLISAAEDYITNYCGLTNPKDLKKDALKQATLMLVGHWYENREASVVGLAINELPLGVLDLIRPYRNWSF